LKIINFLNVIPYSIKYSIKGKYNGLKIDELWIMELGIMNYEL